MGIFKAYKKVALLLFGKLADSTLGSFRGLKHSLTESGTGILLRAWVCIIFLSVALAYVVSLAAMLVVQWVFSFPFELFFYITIFIPILSASFVFMAFYLYPVQKARSIQKSIEVDLPFALAHMSAIASSGIPPESIFKLITGFEEYKSVATQASRIVRNIDTYGMSSVKAISDVAGRTPSPALRQVLNGMVSSIEKGGNLVKYLQETSDKALFEYSTKREKYLKSLSTYADIYTALLVAAPLMMLSVLGVMGIIGGQVMGMTIGDIITLMTWFALPMLNAGFLLFIHITYPGV